MPTLEPNIECLTQLRRVIEAAPEDRLHMNSFYEKLTCGSAYCAAGLAAVDQWFQENTRINEALPVVVLPDGTLAIDDSKMCLTNRLAEVFEISWRDSDNLFAMAGGNLDAHAVSKAEVLNNIGRLIAGKAAKVYAAIEEYLA